MLWASQLLSDRFVCRHGEGEDLWRGVGVRQYGCRLHPRMYSDRSQSQLKLLLRRLGCCCFNCSDCSLSLSLSLSVSDCPRVERHSEHNENITNNKWQLAADERGRSPGSGRSRQASSSKSAFSRTRVGGGEMGVAAMAAGSRAEVYCLPFDDVVIATFLAQTKHRTQSKNSRTVYVRTNVCLCV